MSTGFFWKKFVRVFSCVLSFAIVIAIMLYAGVLSSVRVVDARRKFYFLVSEDTHVQAGAYDAVLNGGAGYLLDVDGREYVVLAVYLTETEGEIVANSFEKDVRLLTVGTGKLYFKTREQKKLCGVVESALSRSYSCMEILNGEIARLDKGGTQESSKRILETLRGQFSYMGEENKEMYPKFSAVCQNAEKRLATICSDIVYAKDLRYLQCELCVSYLELAGEFSL